VKPVRRAEMFRNRGFARPDSARDPDNQPITLLLL
jgi:hypothetical protein